MFSVNTFYDNNFVNNFLLFPPFLDTKIVCNFSYKNFDENMFLLPVNVQDYDNIYALHSDPEMYKNGYKGGVKYMPKNFSNFQNFLEKTLQKGTFLYTIHSKNNGFVGLTGVRNIENKNVEIGGTVIKKELWGKGYNHVSKLCLMNLLKNNNYEKIFFKVNKINHFSATSLKSFGATLCGETVSHHNPEEVFDLYEIVLQEWCMKYEKLLHEKYFFSQKVDSYVL